MAAGQSPKVPVLPYSGNRAAPLSVSAIPSFSPLAIQLLGIVSQENVGLHELAGLVRADPGISVEVLRLANSPLFGARSEITGILHAVAMLGLKRIKSMVMTVAIRDLLSPVRQAEIFAPCWRHSLATAFVCEQLAAEGSQDPDDSYTAGLLHELGQLGLIAARPTEYDRLVHRSLEEGRDLRELERACFGLDHREMGLRLVDAWKLPREFRSFIKCHGVTCRLGALVETGCRLANMLGFRVAGPEEEFDRTRLPGLPPGALTTPEDVEELLGSVAVKINTLECSLVMV